VLPGGGNATDLIRFKQALIFDATKVSNRCQGQHRAIKEAVQRPAGTVPNQPAGI